MEEKGDESSDEETEDKEGVFVKLLQLREQSRGKDLIHDVDQDSSSVNDGEELQNDSELEDTDESVLIADDDSEMNSDTKSREVQLDWKDGLSGKANKHTERKTHTQDR